MKLTELIAKVIAALKAIKPVPRAKPKPPSTRQHTRDT